MKRVDDVFGLLVTRDNLRLALWKALRGKREQADAQEFCHDAEAKFQAIADALESGGYRFGRCIQFVIRDPKERLITAPCFAERVIHHAIMNVCEPVFERALIFDSYACRRGKGREAAVERARHFARRHPFFLKLDIRKYFDSIRHDLLQRRLSQRFKDERLLALFRQIIRSFRGALGRGLPIGALTSQHFANFFLSPLDRFAKETLRVPGYVRYMDDCAFWGASAADLGGVLRSVRAFLASELDLEVKPEPYINRTVHGLDFLGARVFPSHVGLNRRSRVRFSRKLRRLEADYLDGALSELELQQRSESLVAFTTAAGAKTWRFRTRVIASSRVDGLDLEPGSPGRELEQHVRELPVGEP